MQDREKRKRKKLPPPSPVLFLNVYTILSGILGICAQKGRQSDTCFKAESEQQGPWALLYSSAGCLYQNVLCSCEPWQREGQRKWGRERKAWDMQRKANHVSGEEQEKEERLIERERRLNIRSKENTALQNGKIKSHVEHSLLDSYHSLNFFLTLTVIVQYQIYGCLQLLGLLCIYELLSVFQKFLHSFIIYYCYFQKYFDTYQKHFNYERPSYKYILLHLKLW